MLLNFNTAYFDEDFKLIDQRKEIIKNYLKGYFFIDLLAIVPLPQPSVIANDSGRSNDLNSVVRLSRLTRLYRLIKLLRLARIFKMFQE